MTEAVAAPAAAPVAAPVASPAPAPVAAAPAAPAPAPVSAASSLVDSVGTPAAPAPAPAPEAAPLKLPGKDATPADWTTFYRSLGAPEKGEAYGITVPQGADGKFAKEAATWMAEQGLMPQQAQGLVAKWNAFVEQGRTDQAKAAEAAITAAHTKNVAEEATLKTEWGQAHDANLGLAKQAIATFVKPLAGDKAGDLVAAVEGVIGYAATIKLMHSIGKGLGTGQLHGAGNTTGAPNPLAALYPSMFGGEKRNDL